MPKTFYWEDEFLVFGQMAFSTRKNNFRFFFAEKGIFQSLELGFKNGIPNPMKKAITVDF